MRTVSDRLRTHLINFAAAHRSRNRHSLKLLVLYAEWMRDLR